MNFQDLKRYEKLQRDLAYYCEKLENIDKYRYTCDSVVGSSSQWPYQKRVFPIRIGLDDEDIRYYRYSLINNRIDEINCELDELNSKIFRIEDEKIKKILIKRYYRPKIDYKEFYKEFGYNSPMEIERAVISYLKRESNEC